MIYHTVTGREASSISKHRHGTVSLSLILVKGEYNENFIYLVCVIKPDNFFSCCLHQRPMNNINVIHWTLLLLNCINVFHWTLVCPEQYV
jgi:hypothetical protein